MGMKRCVVLGLLLVVACKSAGTEPGDNVLDGSWRWVSSTGSIAGRTVTPETEQYSVRFNFSSNQVTVFRNDSAKATSTVTVRGDEVTYQPSISVFVFDQGIDVQTLRVLAGDTIALADPCCDLYEHRFVRIP